MEQILQNLQEFTGLQGRLALQLLESLAVILVLIVLRWAAIRIAYRQTDDPRVRYRAGKVATYVTVIVGFIVVGRIWFQGVQSLATYLGLVSAGVAVALRDPIVNFAGWLFIVWRRPFAVGDRIQIMDRAGDVVDLRVFQFTILEIGNWVAADQSTGRLIHIPNGKVFTDPLANYVRGFRFIWHEIPLLVTFESDWRKAKGIILDAVVRHAEDLSGEAGERIMQASRKYMIFYTTLTPTVYTTIRDSGVLLTARFLCDPRRRRGTEQAILEEVLERFSSHEDIDFAYPTRRYYYNPVEGKEGARAELRPRGPDGDGPSVGTIESVGGGESTRPGGVDRLSPGE